MDAVKAQPWDIREIEATGCSKILARSAAKDDEPVGEGIMGDTVKTNSSKYWETEKDILKEFSLF